MAINDAYSKFIWNEDSPSLRPVLYWRCLEAAGTGGPYEELTGLNGATLYSRNLAYVASTTSGDKASGIVPGFPTNSYMRFSSSGNYISAAVYSSGWRSVYPNVPIQDRFSAEMWLKTSATPATGTHTLARAMRSGELGLGKVAWVLDVSGGYLRLSVSLRALNDTSLSSDFSRYVVSNTPFSSSTSYYIAFSVSPGSAKLYLDGQLVASTTWNSEKYAIPAPCRSGMEYGPNGYLYGYTAHPWWFGEIALYGYDLSPLQIMDRWYLGKYGYHARVIMGSVVDALSSPLARMVRAHDNTTGRLAGETTSGEDGVFLLRVPRSLGGPFNVVAFDDINAAPDYNAVVKSSVVAI